MNTQTQKQPVQKSSNKNQALKWGLIGGSGVLAATLTALLVNRHKSTIANLAKNTARKTEAMSTKFISDISK